MDISLDFRKMATRDQILDALLDYMNEDQRVQFDEMVSKVAVPDKGHHNVGEVDETIDALVVPDKVKEDMHAVYHILASAEAQVHGCSVEETHFHEVGNASGIRNALAICIAFYVLSPEQVIATPIQVGKGVVECSHGTLSLPAPATAAVLEGLPVCEERLEGERCTPTSAALIKYFVTTFE